MRYSYFEILAEQTYLQFNWCKEREEHVQVTIDGFNYTEVLSDTLIVTGSPVGKSLWSCWDTNQFCGQTMEEKLRFSYWHWFLQLIRQTCKVTLGLHKDIQSAITSVRTICSELDRKYIIPAGKISAGRFSKLSFYVKRNELARSPGEIYRARKELTEDKKLL